MVMARVLLADSQPLFNEALEALFSRDDVHQVIGRCSSADDAFAHVSSLRPDLVLVDATLGLEGSPGAGLAGEGAVPRGMLLELARRMVARDRTPDSPLSRLSPRERQVLALLSKGWDNARIGRDLFISQHTVRTHIQNILEKLGMHSKLEAATFAMQRSMELELTPGGAGLDT